MQAQLLEVFRAPAVQKPEAELLIVARRSVQISYVRFGVPCHGLGMHISLLSWHNPMRRIVEYPVPKGGVKLRLSGWLCRDQDSGTAKSEGRSLGSLMSRCSDLHSIGFGFLSPTILDA